MSTATNQTLSRAYELIEAGQLDEARAILQPLLAVEKNNPDVWWVYAHAVDDPAEARSALNNVLRLDPSYPDAAQLLQSLEPQTPVPATPTGIRSLGQAMPPSVPETLPDLPDGNAEPDFFDEWDEESEDEELDTAEAGSGARRLLIPLLAVIVILVVIAAVLIIVRPFGTSVRTTPTPADIALGVPTDTSVPLVAATDTGAPLLNITDTAVPELVVTETDVPTETATETDVLRATATDTEVPDVVATAEVTTQTGDNTDFAALYSALDGFTVPDEGIEITPTTLGDTLLVTICATAAELRTTLPDTLEIVAEQSAAIAEQVDALGVRIVNCADDVVLRIIAVRTQDALAYADGTLDERDFQKSWQPIG
jgi:hypothetical protein